LNDKKVIGFEDNQNERQIEKKLFYEKKHFDHLNGDDLHKMAKLSPIAVSEEDIELQADIDRKEDKSLRKTHHKSETDLHLQDLNQQNPNSKVEQISDKNEDKDKDKHRKHKHSSHKKHEVLRNDKHHHKNIKSEESYGKHFGSKDKFRTKDSLNYKHNKEQKHMKNHNKKHEKKSKQEFSKKYRKYNKYY
jgi:hypothetical protein